MGFGLDGSALRLGEVFASCLCFSGGDGKSSVEAWYTTALEIEESLSGVVDSHVRIFVADVIKSLDTVDRTILDCVLLIVSSVRSTDAQKVPTPTKKHRQPSFPSHQSRAHRNVCHIKRCNGVLPTSLRSSSSAIGS